MPDKTNVEINTISTSTAHQKKTSNFKQQDQRHEEQMCENRMPKSADGSSWRERTYGGHYWVGLEPKYLGTIPDLEGVTS